MDDTELHYVTYDPDEIWLEMQKAYIAAGGNALYPGDEKEMLLRGALSVFVQLLAGVDNGLRMQTLRYAVGEYLDVLGESRNCPRIQPTAAKAKVQITANAIGVTSVIPAGSAMTADGENYYTTDEDITLSGVAETLFAYITAAETGSAGNALTLDAQMYLSSGNAGVNSIVVTEAASGGTDAEKDEAYRERIRRHGLATVTTGTAKQYEDAAKAASSEVVDAKAFNYSPGEVLISMILTPEHERDASVYDAVLAAVRADDVKPLTDTVRVGEAFAVSYTLNVEYTSDSNISAAVAAAVAEYQQWQDYAVGRAFNPFKLMAALFNAGATTVRWGEGSEVGIGGDVDYTPIDPDGRWQGTITITAGESE